MSSGAAGPAARRFLGSTGCRLDPGRILDGKGGEHSERMAAQARKGQDVGLDTGAGRGSLAAKTSTSGGVAVMGIRPDGEKFDNYLRFPILSEIP